jgi:hypothetical protein
MSNFFDSSQFNEDENALIAKGIKLELVVALHEAVNASIAELGNNLPKLTTRVNESIKVILDLFDYHHVDYYAICKELITKVFMEGHWYSLNEAEKCKAVGVRVLNIFENAEELIELPSMTMGL